MFFFSLTLVSVLVTQSCEDTLTVITCIIFKRSSARSWKPVFAVLRGHVLYLHKDKGMAHQVSVNIKESQ